MRPPGIQPPPESRQIPGKKSVRAPASSGFSPPMHSVHSVVERPRFLSVPHLESRAASSHKNSASQSQLSIPIALGDMRNWEYAPSKNSAFSSLLHSRAMTSNLITQAKTQHQPTVDLHSCISIWSTLTCMGSLPFAYTLCPFDADSQLVTAHAFGLALICGALVGFLCHPDSGGEEALRQRLGVSPSWEKSLFAATGTTLSAALLVASCHFCGSFILSLLVLFATVLLVGTNVALPGAEISWTHRTRHLLQTGIQGLFCRSRELAALVGFCFLLQRPIDSLLTSHPDVSYMLCALLLVAGAMVFGKISPTTSPDGNSPKDADVVLKHLRSCGLNELQAQIALLIARGDSE